MAMGHTTHLHAEFQSELHVRKCLIDIFPPVEMKQIPGYFAWVGEFWFT